MSVGESIVYQTFRALKPDGHLHPSTRQTLSVCNFAIHAARSKGGCHEIKQHHWERNCRRPSGLIHLLYFLRIWKVYCHRVLKNVYA